MRITSPSLQPPPLLHRLPPLLSPFGAYPNVLELTDEHRQQQFHPVLRFLETPTIVDYTTSTTATGSVSANTNQLMRMATVDEWKQPRDETTGGTGEGEWSPSGVPAGSTTSTSSTTTNPLAPTQQHASSSSAAERPIWTLGRYDEDRIGLYESPLFQNVSNDVNGFAGKRTVHVGIDLGGPVHTPIYSFYDGVVHSVGYNPDLGDYGHVIVIYYPQLPSGRQVYALYGHLDATVLQHKVGDSIRTGQVLGGLGDVHENGGWLVPHVHFQLGVTAPATHDMAGAVSVEDRERALLEHPDPRYVLGPLH